MNEHEAEAEIRSGTVVTNQVLTFAKAFLYNLDGAGPYDPRTLIREFTRDQGYSLPDKVVLHPSVDPNPAIEQTAGYARCAMALAEAIWALIYNGYFWYFGPVEHGRIDQQWTTVVPGGGGTSSGWTFDDLGYDLPRVLWKTPSHRTEKTEILTDPDIYLSKVNIPNANEEVIEAIDDAILCFKHGLYRAAVTMLGKASEGAWVEMGCSIAKASSQESERKQRIIQKLLDDSVSVPAKVKQVFELYKNRDLCGYIVKETEILPSSIENIVIWSNVLREARNAIHFGVRPTIPNSYEKVSVLLIDGAKNFSLMYRIKDASDIIATQS